MSEDMREVKARFDEVMMDVYRRALEECNYRATRFLQMLPGKRAAALCPPAGQA